VTTLTTNPTYPVPTRACELVFTLTEAATNFVRVWVTIAPEGSELDIQLTRERKTRLEVYAGNGDAEFPFAFTPDKGGKYTFVAQEYTKGNAVGGDYEDDPRGAPAETKVGSEATLSLYIGQRLTQKLGTGGDTATLALWVWNDTIRATTVEVHGELSPAIESGSASSQAAKNAAESTSVLAAVAALAGVAVDTAIGTMSSLVSNFAARWNVHVGSAAFHANADTVNPMPAGLSTASEPGNLREFVNQALLLMRQHFTNDDGTGEIDAADYHHVDTKVNDWASMPIVPSVNSVQESYAGFAELHRCYEAHRIAANVVTHVASQAQSSLTATTSATTTIPSCLAGDVLIVPVVNRDAIAAPTVVDNDTGGNTWARADTGDDGLTVWWKRATANTSAKVITASGATGSIASGVSVFRGCRTTGNPFENVSKESNLSSVEAHGALTPTVGNAHVVLVVANRTDDIDVSAVTATNPSALSERLDVMNTGGSDCSVAVASASQAGAPTATGGLVWAQADAASLSCAFNLIPVAGSIHDTSDTTALTALSALLSLHSAFFGVLAATSPTPPPAQSSGAVLLVQRAGFSESP
jgi:hypothetical protein